MKKQFIVFYNEDGLINNIGIWQKMNEKGNRMLIEFIDYSEMLVVCSVNRHIETRYKKRVVEQCVWMDTDEVLKSNHQFIQLRDENLLKEKFVKSEMLREAMNGKGGSLLTVWQ